ncbi:hypothetical protein KOAAANKH_02277 [Brevundimonas sp. NIBR10]|uniref:peptidoglycan DD-metalloendopeptidase family protein n=1 Tax=Brevundimonas sp. NIBR10 TaxID=3015997 RepID=UPI0022F19BEB|nr:peptidoglycan DD-metalloendopeptidase family protein [Brevundimonas sp. NIBR10]WGM47400.1 hypothetical protein KOAAANKH_02277 [Brevundimonas sp. NIBR10]
MGMGGWTRLFLIAGAALTAAACSSYPDAPRYSTRADGTVGPAAYPPQPVYPTTRPAPVEAPPPLTAPIEPIEGGALPTATITSGLNGGPSRPVVVPAPVNEVPSEPAYEPSSSVSVPSASEGGRKAYVIQPGDTISGVGRRFRTPVQALIDLNNLGPRAAITPGQRILLPASATDLGSDPYATGPGLIVVEGIVDETEIPPPPAPPVVAAPRPVQTVPVPVAPRPAPTPAPSPSPAPAAPATAGGLALQWPVRGDIVRRFGPVAMGERNNGINIGAEAGAEVRAAAAGRVAYVGDDLVGQGLTVLIVHRDGWRTVYGHLGSATVANNADVRAGQQIGTVGLTAGDGRPSIHFETRRMQGDNPVAVDPLTVLPR